MKIKEIISIIIATSLSLSATAQKKNWQNLDLDRDSVFGISTEKAYAELLKNKKASTVIVAVIDMGLDTSHEDLRSVVWTNKKEIPGNGIDDDHNGYIDDIHGWNFLGSEIGAEDITNLALKQKDFYDSLSYTKVSEALRPQFAKWKKCWNEYNSHLSNAQTFMQQAIDTRSLLDTMLARIGKADPTSADFETYSPRNKEEKSLRASVLKILLHYKDFNQYKTREIDQVIALMEYHNSHGLNFYNTPDSSRSPANAFYGDNDICGPMTLLYPNQGPFHGTHLAGIIAANRNNNIGIMGVADHTEIMPLKVMSFYRELRDQDLANAIRYAADNGAKIINLSFGKPYTFNKKLVDEAVKYAMTKNVFIIHSSGNDGTDIDKNIIFPNPVYDDSTGRAHAWLEVGATGFKNDSNLVATFSNYGKSRVDVFAPGVNINSTTPLDNYVSMSGTSMAAPVVAGIAALIMEYYPKLTAIQVKEIIMNSVIKREILKDKCVSGGVVNAYNALKLASTYK